MMSAVSPAIVKLENIYKYLCLSKSPPLFCSLFIYSFIFGAGDQTRALYRLNMHSTLSYIPSPLTFLFKIY